jgi:hypothetical protein
MPDKPPSFQDDGSGMTANCAERFKLLFFFNNDAFRPVAV